MDKAYTSLPFCILYKSICTYKMLHTQPYRFLSEGYKNGFSEITYNIPMR